MAEDDPVRHLCEEATCPVCLEYFQEPVVAECGHVFCRACIAQCCAKAGGEEATCCCPQCREPLQQSGLRPVLPLASIVGIAQKFCLQLAKGVEAMGRTCPRHQEPLKLFCRDDETPICVVCDKSREHRGHQVIPKEEALEEYKGTIRSHLEFLEQEKNAVLSSKLLGETESQSLLEKTEVQRQKIVAEFKELHEFLEERERLLLAQLKDLDDEINDHSEKHRAKLLEKFSSFDQLIKEMEEKQEHPVDEFLQDLRNTLQRFQTKEFELLLRKFCGVPKEDLSVDWKWCPKERFISPEAFPIDLKERIEKLSKMHPFLNSTIKTFKDTVIAGPPENKVLPTPPWMHPENSFHSMFYPPNTGHSFFH